MITRSMIASCALLVLMIGAAESHAQIEKLRGEVRAEAEELQSLERIITALNNGDSTYASYFPMWTVLDKNLRLSIYAAFRNRGKEFSEEEQVVVIADPTLKRIADIRIGKTSYGRLFASRALDPELQRTLLERNYANISELPAGYKNDLRRRRELPTDVPSWVSMNISLFSGEMRFGNHWRISGKVGNDELGYPFWSSGQVTLLAGYKSVNLGAYLPMHGGVFETNPADRPLSLKPRLLNGSSGAAGRFEFEWDAVKLNSERVTYGAIGGSFAVGSLDRRRPEYLTANLDRLYSISTIVQTYYAFNYNFDEGEKVLNARVGGTFHRVTVNRFVHDEIFRYDAENFVTPLIAVEYKNLGADWFKLHAQYSRLLSVGAWAEIVPRYVYAEVKYAVPFLRSARQWEQAYYLYGTLGFTFDF